MALREGEPKGRRHFERVFCTIVALGQASLKTYLSGSPGTETKRAGQRTAVYGTDAPKDPALRRGGGVTRITLDWVIGRSFTTTGVTSHSCCCFYF